MRPIDADAFDRDLCNARFTAALNEAYDGDTSFEDREMYYSTQSFRDVMRYRPTLDVRPVVHAYWKDVTYDQTESHYAYQCSACAYRVWIPKWQHPADQHLFYCAECVATMDKEKTNGHSD